MLHFFSKLSSAKVDGIEKAMAIYHSCLANQQIRLQWTQER